MGQRGGIPERRAMASASSARRSPPLPVAGEDELQAEDGEQPGPGRAVVGPRPPRAPPSSTATRSWSTLADALKNVPRVLASAARASASASPRSAARRAASQQGLPVGRITRPALGLAQGDQELGAVARSAARLGGVEQFEGLAVVGHRLVVGQLGQGPVTGPGGVVHGPGGLGRRGRRPGPVVGQGRAGGRRGAAVDRLDGLRHPAVEGHPPGGGELVVERGPHERVGEAVARPPGTSTTRRAAVGLLQRGEELVLAETPGHARPRPARTPARPPPPPPGPGWSPRRGGTAAGRPRPGPPRGCRAPRRAAGRTQRPSRCSTAPVSARWRRTSRTKKGLPSVSRHTARGSSEPPRRRGRGRQPAR